MAAMTVDEYRENVLKLEPLGGEIGKRMLKDGAPPEKDPADKKLPKE